MGWAAKTGLQYQIYEVIKSQLFQVQLKPDKTGYNEVLDRHP